MNWPARSPDLSALDFFLWGFMKSIVYRTPVQDLQDLEQRIEQAVRQITPEMVANCKRSLLERARCCVQQQGGHFEHLIH